MFPTSPLATGLRDYPITLALITVCIGLFLWQLATGVDPNQPSHADLLRWGANFLPFTLDSQPWRMVSSLFLHIGLMHLMFNMFALYYFGQVAERMFGSHHLLALFLLSGIGGNVLNNYLGWEGVLVGTPPVVSAGASGGIMGIGMALLVTALLKTPMQGLQLSFRSLLMVMVINLGYGFLVGGVDNAGHVGGALVGGLLGFLYVWQYRRLLTSALINQATHPDRALSQPSQPYPISLTTYTILMAYAALLLVFGVIYWQLHTALATLLATSAVHSMAQF